jgi:hypothetical protein
MCPEVSPQKLFPARCPDGPPCKQRGFRCCSHTGIALDYTQHVCFRAKVIGMILAFCFALCARPQTDEFILEIKCRCIYPILGLRRV